MGPLLIAGAAGAIIGAAVSILVPRADTVLLDSGSGDIGIPELINRVRQELIASEESRLENKLPALFVAKSLDLEISFVAKRSAELGSKVVLTAVEAGATVGLESEKTHKMTLHLEVQPPESGSIPPTKHE
jgi:hypothetical protein